MTIRRLCLACLALATFSLWLRSGFPAFGIPGAPDDDGLFVALARHLGAGQWLGPFDSRTLVKGMFYPLFILGSFVVGVPVKIAEQVVYLGAAWLVAWALFRHAARPWLALVAFAALALNPVVWTTPLGRVIREGLYIGESLGLVGLLVLAGWARGWVARVALGASAGFGGGAFWLTREEGVWVLPAVLAVAAGVVLDAVIRRPGAPTSVEIRPVWPDAAFRLAVPGLAAALAFGLAIGSVAEMNRRYYGVFQVNEIKSASFRHAYGALSRITPDHWARYVVVPSDARARAYVASPAARELSGSLDGPTGGFWREAGCRQTATSPCPDILAGWFLWALRSAVVEAGHYGSARDARNFYDRLGREIDVACERGDLPCGPPRATLAPPFRWGYVADTLRMMPRLALLVFGMEPDAFGGWPSLGTAEQRALFADMVGPLNPAEPDPLAQAGARRRALIQAVAWPISRAYAAVMPVGAGLAFVGLLFGVARWRRRPPSILLLTLAGASAAALGARIVLLSYLEVTAIPSANILYASPATPFAILFVVVGCWIGMEAVLMRQQTSRYLV